jgi:hypothetical protein
VDECQLRALTCTDGRDALPGCDGEHNTERLAPDEAPEAGRVVGERNVRKRALRDREHVLRATQEDAHLDHVLAHGPASAPRSGSRGSGRARDSPAHLERELEREVVCRLLELFLTDALS